MMYYYLSLKSISELKNYGWQVGSLMNDRETIDREKSCEAGKGEVVERQGR